MSEQEQSCPKSGSPQAPRQRWPAEPAAERRRPGAGRSGGKPAGRGGPKRDGQRATAVASTAVRGATTRPGPQRVAHRQQARYDGPPIPEEITGRELDRSVQAQLKSLPEKLGAAGGTPPGGRRLLIDTDPKTAYEHTLAARARASRLAVVREAVGEAAYAAGDTPRRWPSSGRPSG